MDLLTDNFFFPLRRGRTQRNIPLCNLRVENERSFYRGTRRSLALSFSIQTLGGGGGISQPPPSCFFSSRDTSRGFPFAVPPPFTQGWIRFRRMKSPGGLDSVTHRSSLHIYIYIYTWYIVGYHCRRNKVVAGRDKQHRFAGMELFLSYNLFNPRHFSSTKPFSAIIVRSVFSYPLEILHATIYIYWVGN